MHPDEIAQEYRNIGRLPDYVREHDALKEIEVAARHFIRGFNFFHFGSNEMHSRIMALSVALNDLEDVRRKNNGR